MLMDTIHNELDMYKFWHLSPTLYSDVQAIPEVKALATGHILQYCHKHKQQDNVGHAAVNKMDRLSIPIVCLDINIKYKPA